MEDPNLKAALKAESDTDIPTEDFDLHHFSYSNSGIPDLLFHWSASVNKQ